MADREINFKGVGIPLGIPVEDPKESFYTIPTTPQFTATHQAMGATVEGIKTFGIRKELITDGTEFTIETAEKAGTVDITYKTKRGLTTFTIPDTSQVNVAAQNLYPYLVIKACRECISKGNLYSDTLSIKASELVDIGLYSTPQSARVALQDAADPLQLIRIGCREEDQEGEEGEEKKEPKFKKRVLFPSIDYEEGTLAVQLNNKMDWKAFTSDWGKLPSYVFSLPSIRARNLLIYIFGQARQHSTNRQNIKTTPEGKPCLVFNIKFKTLLTVLHLPSLYKVDKDGKKSLIKKGYEKIKKPIEQTIAEIEEAHRKTYHNTDFQLLPIVNDKLKLDDWVEEGYLQVTFIGAFYSYYKTILESMTSKIESNTKKKEKREEEAKTRALAKSMEQQQAASEQASEN